MLVRFQDRVEQVHAFFRKCRDNLAMVYQTMLPLNPQPRGLLQLMEKVKTPVKVRQLVRDQLIAGAEVAFSFVQSKYPTLDFNIIAAAEVDIAHYAPMVTGAAATVIRKLQEADEAQLQRIRASQPETSNS